MDERRKGGKEERGQTPDARNCRAGDVQPGRGASRAEAKRAPGQSERRASLQASDQRVAIQGI